MKFDFMPHLKVRPIIHSIKGVLSIYRRKQNFTHPLNKILHNNNEPIFMNSQENGDAQTLTKIYIQCGVG